ncbi:hypothetical protein EEB14_20725 [Rhodococcus sp. WS4]|nr:hypothetical protein EEB14_20725 [Rhodococcus sp. WS4]
MPPLPLIIQRRDDWNVDGGVPLRGTPIPVGRGGAIVEIKPHNKSGERSGLDQLYKSKFGNKTSRPPRKPTDPKSAQWLLTYLPVNDSGAPVHSGRASAVKIFARRVTWSAENRKAYRFGLQYVVGTRTLPALIPFPRVDQAGFFGSAVEGHVRAHLFRKTSRQAVRGTGGSRPGPDARLKARLKELTELYEELARIVPDPLYAEIAAELSMRGE